MSLLKQSLRKINPTSSLSKCCNTFSTVTPPKLNPPRLFDYKTIVENLKPSPIIVEAIESAFGKLAKGQVDVPIPMHIGIHESETAGPGDCHIKGIVA